MPLPTNHLIKPQERVFTRKRRNYGAASVAMAIISVAILVPVYASFVGTLVPFCWVMLPAAFLAAMVVPWLVARLLRFQGPRLFAAVNVSMAFLLFVVWGGQTDRALEREGLTPFVAVAKLVGANEGDQHAVTSAGVLLVDVLRYLTVSGDKLGEGEEAAAEKKEVGEDEPRVEIGEGAERSVRLRDSERLADGQRRQGRSAGGEAGL